MTGRHASTDDAKTAIMMHVCMGELEKHLILKSVRLWACIPKSNPA